MSTKEESKNVSIINEDAKIEYPNLMMEMSYKEIVRPFVFVNVQAVINTMKTGIGTVMLDYTSDDPFLNTCRDGMGSYLVAADMTNNNSREIIYGLSKLYSEYAANLIVTNLLVTVNDHLVDTLRTYCKDREEFNKRFNYKIDDIINGLPPFIQGVFTDFIKKYIEKIVENDEFAQSTNPAVIRKGDFIVEALSSMTCNPVMRITAGFTDLANELLAAELIDYDKMFKDKHKLKLDDFDSPVDEPTIRMACAHRFIMSQLNDDMAVLNDIIEIITVNALDKISADIQDHVDIFKAVYLENKDKRYY